jgi:penicillin-binding protein 1A
MARFWLIFSNITLGVIGALTISLGYWVTQINLPDIHALSHLTWQQPLRIYTSDHVLLAEIGAFKRTPIAFTHIPSLFIKAILAAEDKRFFEHHGVDGYGLLRAAGELWRTGHKTQGGSTITMQLARNCFLSSEKTFNRKLKEIILAFKIEKYFKKYDILEWYLNTIYFGKGAYGIVSAAHLYFGKSLQELSLAEMALLAGLPKAPSALNPFNNPKASMNRRAYVLNRMLMEHAITPLAYAKAIHEPLHLMTLKPLVGPYVVETVRQILLKTWPAEWVYTKGFNVYTTIHSTWQKEAEASIAQQLTLYEKRYHRQPDAAFVALDPTTGAIRAMVGGRNFQNSMYNRALQATRQPGSAFKPFIYAMALKKGYTLATIIDGSPLHFKNKDGTLWSPHNWNDQQQGWMRLRTALSRSVNVITIRLLQAMGVPDTLQHLQQLGMPDAALPPSLALALGAGVITPMQLATLYALFANGGYRIHPFLIEHIDAPGIHYTASLLPYCDGHDGACMPHVLSEQVAFLITDVLKDVLITGTGAIAHQHLPLTYMAGKTGSTNDYKDAWFAGYTPNRVAVVWVGFDQPQSLHEYGSQLALPIWIQWMKQTLTEDVPFTMPAGITQRTIDPTTGELSDEGIHEWFDDQTLVAVQDNAWHNPDTVTVSSDDWSPDDPMMIT